MNFSDVPQDVPAPTPRRGRPRSQETIDRDTQVLTALREGGPQTKEQLVAKLNLAPQLVYLSLWRLRRTSQVTRPATGSDRHIWTVVA
jgi:hypothetical protein